MNARSTDLFDYRFRTDGTPIDGPIRSAVGTTATGWVLIARSAAGVCAILLGEDPKAVRDELAASFPGHAVVEDREGLVRELAQVIAFLDGDAEDHSNVRALVQTIALDIGGTPFQQQVWRALMTIPTGRTRSYAEVADAIGQPGAARAVAGACAANVLAVAIPCHRVVRSDGTPTGYRWGHARREALLVGEGAR